MPNVTFPALQTPQAMPQANVAAMQTASKDKNVAKIKETAKNFEAMYMQEMLQHMWDGVGTDKLMGGGRGEEVFRSLMIEQYGKMIADSGQTKISDVLSRQMLRMQEEQSHPRGFAMPLKTNSIPTGESHE